MPRGLCTRAVIETTTLAVLLASGAAIGAAEKTGQARPNILYIMTDQQPLSCVGAYGNPGIRTPALDTLARDGCVFRQFFIAAFPCSPSRACMLTGRYSHNHGVVTNDDLDELYDLKADPGEMNNLASVAEHKAPVDRMTHQILSWLRDTKHPYANAIAARIRTGTEHTTKQPG